MRNNGSKDAETVKTVCCCRRSVLHTRDTHSTDDVHASVIRQNISLRIMTAVSKHQLSNSKLVTDCIKVSQMLQTHAHCMSATQNSAKRMDGYRFPSRNWMGITAGSEYTYSTTTDYLIAFSRQLSTVY